VANTKSAKKRIIQNDTHRKRNVMLRSMYRTYIKKMELIIKENRKEDAMNIFANVSSILDKVAAKGIIHKNKAARHKSQLNHKIKNLKST